MLRLRSELKHVVPVAGLVGPVVTRLLIVTADDLGLTRRRQRGGPAGPRGRDRHGDVAAGRRPRVRRRRGDAARPADARAGRAPRARRGGPAAAVRPGDPDPRRRPGRVPAELPHGRAPRPRRPPRPRRRAPRARAPSCSACSASGVPVTHVDTHQHTHLWPTVATVVADLARDGRRAARSGSPAATRTRPSASGSGCCRAGPARRCVAAGRATTAGLRGSRRGRHLDADAVPRGRCDAAARRGARDARDQHPPGAGRATPTCAGSLGLPVGRRARHAHRPGGARRDRRRRLRPGRVRRPAPTTDGAA